MDSKAKKNAEYLITRALETDQGRIALASALVQPIRKALDYLGIARKVLQPDVLADGVLPVYEKDIDAVAFKITNLGRLASPQVQGDQVALDTFIIGVNPEITRHSLRKRRFNVINRIQARSRATIQEAEDKELFSLLEAAGSANISGSIYANTSYTGNVTRAVLGDATAGMMQQNLPATKIVGSPLALKGIYSSWTNADYDPITQHQVLKTGLIGKVFGADIYLSKMATTNRVYAVADPEFLGVMPIRQDIEVLDAPNHKELKLGWAIYEEIGMAVLNNTGVYKITQS